MPPLSARPVIVQPRIVRQRGEETRQPTSFKRALYTERLLLSHDPCLVGEPQPLQKYHAAYITTRVFYGPQLACVSRNLCCVHNSIWHYRSRTLKETFHKTAACDETAHPPPTPNLWSRFVSAEYRGGCTWLLSGFPAYKRETSVSHRRL